MNIKIKSWILQLAAVSAIVLTQGCITAQTQRNGVAARHKGPWRNDYKTKAPVQSEIIDDQVVLQEGIPMDDLLTEEVVMESSSSVSFPEPLPSTPSGSTQTYVVQKGDVLSKIAVRFDTTTRTLVAMNNLSNPDVLYVGQEILVPANGSSAATTASYSSSPSLKKGGTYVIQKGDTLSGIAVAAGVKLADLRSLNNISGDKIYAGQKLQIPAYGKVPAHTKKLKSHKKKSVVKTHSTPIPAPQAAPVMAPAPAPMAEPTPAPVAQQEVATQVIEESVGYGEASLDAVVDHVVYPGDTLDNIALQYGVSKVEIMRLNNLSSETDLQEGQRLRIPVAK